MLRSPLPGLAAALLLCLAAAPAGAEPPAAIPPADSSAHASFHSFARAWMEKLARVESENRKASQVSYRGYGKDFTTKLRATGNPASPYVGVLSYQEFVYQCGGRESCRVASVVPVMEIFRLRGGRWVY
jgi:hypothetical protein